jgi:hypothetical protein
MRLEPKLEPSFLLQRIPTRVVNAGSSNQGTGAAVIHS